MLNSDDLVDLGEKHHQAGQLQEAESCYRQALEIDSSHPGALYFLAGIACDDGRLQLATQLVEELLRGEPNDAEAWHLLGMAALKERTIPRAIDCFKKALAIQPAYAQAHYSLGSALGGQGDVDAALESFQRAIKLNPAFAEAHCAMGNILKAQGNLEAAISSYQQAIDAKPDFALAYESIGGILLSQGRLDEAITIYRKAVAENPNSSNLHLHLGRALMENNQDADAIANFERTVSLDPRCAEAYGRLGHLLTKQYRINEGIAAFQRAVALTPESSRFPFYLAQSFHKAGRLTESIACLKQSIALNPNNVDTHTALLGTQLYSPGYSPEQVFADRVAFAERFEAPLRKNWPQRPKAINSQKRLRIGIVSGDLLSHPVGYFLEGVLRELRKRDGIDIIIYSTNAEADVVTDRIRAAAHIWSTVAALSDDAFERRIRGDNVDILVDLSGHTGLNRLLVFARKPAPIQVTWLGDCATTGLKSVDYILCDRYSVRDGEAKFYVEKPWFLPHTRLCFTPPTESLAVASLPALTAGYVTFGCFNNLIKMTDGVVAVWARILKRISNARLMLKSLSFHDYNFRKNVIARFAAHGIGADRLLLKLGSLRRAYFSEYNQVDIALDPFPFTGGTTSIDGIWMGVPMITMRGDRIISRQGESILHNIGLQDWIADNEDDYVELAVRRAEDLAGLATLRRQLRAKLEASPVCDAKLFARHLEEAFMRMWQNYCK